ncbi:MAG: hypothetical protein ACK515_27335 [bacterium]|jgi:hypothetical protein|nr:hypothetical protein [Betaproteobacteria bacterium]
MKHTLALAAAAVSMLVSTAHANLILNGSFELPATPVGGYTVYDRFGAEKIDSWQVQRTGGGFAVNRIVAVVNGSYTEGGYSFPASDGDNWVDLTGLLTGVTAGVLQNFVSVPGQT